MKVRDKRGFQLAVETAIIMVLAVAILISIFGFWAYQRGIFSDFLKEHGEKPNVDEVVGVCNGLVEREAVYEFCCSDKEVKYLEEDELVEREMTCDELSEQSFVNNRVNKMECENAC